MSVDRIADFLSLTYFSEYLIVMIPIFECAIFATIFLVGLFVKKIRLLDKSALASSATASLALLAAKAVLTENTNRKTISAGALFVGIAFLLLSALTIQNRLELRPKRKYRPTDYLSDDFQPSLAETALKKIAKRHPYEIKANKGFSTENEPCAVNYSEILSFIRKIEQKSPDPKDEKALDELKADVRKFSNGNLCDAERKRLSNELSGLIKIMAKYDVL